MCSKLLKKYKLVLTRKDKSYIKRVMDYALDLPDDQYNDIMIAFCKLLEGGFNLKEAAAIVSNDEIV